MVKLIEITGKALSGEWGTDDEIGNGIPVLRTTNFTNEGVVDYSDIVTRTITKKNIDEKYLRPGDIIIEKSGGSDKQPVGRVIYFDGPGKTYLFNNFTGLLRVSDQTKWFPKYVFYSLFGNYRRGGTRPFENKTTGLHNLKTNDYVSRYEITETEYAKQVEISSYLDKLYSIIKMREEELVKLDELIKARFVEMFGEQKINPYGFSKSTIGECCSLKSGTSLPVDKENEGGDIPYVKVGDMNYPGNERYITTSSRYVTEDTAGKGLFDVGSIIFPKRGGAIRTNKKRMTVVPICADLNVMGVSSNGSLMSEYLLVYFDMIDMGELADGSSVPQINNKNIAPLEILIPPMEVQKQFADFVKQVDKSKVVVLRRLIQDCRNNVFAMHGMLGYL